MICMRRTHSHEHDVAIPYFCHKLIYTLSLNHNGCGGLPKLMPFNVDIWIHISAVTYLEWNKSLHWKRIARKVIEGGVLLEIEQ